MRLIDLSQPLFDDAPNCPVHPPVSFRRTADHAPDGWRMEEIAMATHTGSHLDAPLHKIAGGKSISELPLEGFVGPARIADLRQIPADTAIGPALLAQACKMGLEGIISKVADAPYRSGRGHDWLKTKCSDRQEFVIAGFAPSTADANAVGALVLGIHEKGKLHYAGRTGTGFTHKVARDLYRKLKALAVKT